MGLWCELHWVQHETHQTGIRAHWIDWGMSCGGEVFLRGFLTEKWKFLWNTSKLWLLPGSRVIYSCSEALCVFTVEVLPQSRSFSTQHKAGSPAEVKKRLKLKIKSRNEPVKLFKMAFYLLLFLPYARYTDIFQPKYEMRWNHSGGHSLMERHTTTNLAWPDLWYERKSMKPASSAAVDPLSGNASMLIGAGADKYQPSGNTSMLIGAGAD